MAASDAIRQIDVSEVTYYRWRKEYRGMAIYKLKGGQEYLALGQNELPSL